MQYPNKLMANAWDLASSSRYNHDSEEVLEESLRDEIAAHEANAGKVSGFSGTNDNQQVLPLQVMQVGIDALVGTNGRMMKKLLENTTYITLPDIQWHSVVDIALKEKCTAIIDSGALTVGASSNFDVAFYLHKRIDWSQFRGVLFSDGNTDGPQWLIMDRHGQCRVKHLSPIREHECFLFFDEARARGSDLKQRQDAKALVTIGPNMIKDKLMQAIGRMRLLFAGQTLCFVGTGEITEKIKRSLELASTVKRSRQHMIPTSSGLTSTDMLRWVVLNTIAAVQDALVQWARQGSTFATTRTADAAMLDETNDLETMYRGALVSQKASDAICKDVDVLRQRAPEQLDAKMLQLLEGIKSRAMTLGHDFEVIHSTFEEEYERELEKEVEVMEETEVQIPTREPSEETDWQYERIFEATSTEDLARLGCSTLRLVGNLGTQPVIRNAQWPQNILRTANFALDVQPMSPFNDIKDRYSRVVDAALIFECDKTVVLLSEREANGLIPVFWRLGDQPSNVNLINFSFLRDANESPISLILPRSAILPSTLLGDTTEITLAALQLFMAETSYPLNERRNTLMNFLHHACTGSRKDLVDALVSSRGTSHTYARSDLASLLIEAPWLH